ncbi:MAG: hypothetical protein ACJ79A_10595 [Gemmatimonadaceae bacterium]
MPRSTHVAGPRTIAVRVAAPTLIAIGYVDLARGGVVIAPLALMIGYLVLVPFALFTD